MLPQRALSLSPACSPACVLEQAYGAFIIGIVGAVVYTGSAKLLHRCAHAEQLGRGWPMATALLLPLPLPCAVAGLWRLGVGRGGLL